MKATTEFTGRFVSNVTHIYSGDDGSNKRAVFTIAVNSSYSGKDGEKKEKVDYIPCIAWGTGFVDMLTQWGIKGRQVHIRGVLDTYQAPPDADGKYPPQKIQVRIIPGGFEFMDKKPATGIDETPKKTETAPVDADKLQAIAKLVAAEMLGQVNSETKTAETPVTAPRKKTKKKKATETPITAPQSALADALSGLV